MADSLANGLAVRARTVAAPAAPARARRPRSRSRSRLVPLLYTAPALLFYLAFVIAPWLHSLWISFWDWNGIGVATWAGLGNYRGIVSDPALRLSLIHAFGLIVFYSVIPICLGLVLAALVANMPWKGMPFVRTVIFLPQILPLVAVGSVWKLFFDDDGPLNSVLRTVGLDNATRAWLGDFTWAYPAVGVVGTWVSTGLCFLLLYSGIGKIDPALYEAARLDGAGAVHEFRHVTVPGLRRELSVAATVTVIAALASFDVVYVMTGGGPGEATMVPGVAIYRLTFTAGQVGTACALATVLSVLTCAVMYVLNRLTREKP
ncbi:carbohydrate ABC transporter permease [Micromonospora tulbaghiae]|uniref:carbohydrate ABC transporter permease n=1 Tax=Micromonospora tulbaghiae TaxID=479978 RepID=UPI0037187678